MHLFKASLLILLIEMAFSLSTKGQALLPVKSSEKIPIIMGNLVSSSLWEKNNPQYGIYTLTVGETPTFNPVALASELDPKTGGFFIGNKYYFANLKVKDGVRRGSRFVYNIETKTFEVKEKECPLNALISGSAAVYDRTTRRVYGVFYNENFQSEFGWLDPETYTRTKIKDFYGYVFRNIAISSKGDIYGITKTGEFYYINKENGNVELKGTTGLSPQLGQGAVIDPITDKYYWAYRDLDVSALYTIDITNGKSTKVCDLPANTSFINLTIAEATADDKAPSSVESFTVANTNGTDLSVSFVLPTKTADNKDNLQGQLTYKIIINDNEVSSGIGYPGEIISLNLPNQSNGSLRIGVYALNEKGKGVVSNKNMWNGPDVPQKPATADLVISGDQAKITWSAAAATGLHGKPIDVSKLT